MRTFRQFRTFLARDKFSSFEWRAQEIDSRVNVGLSPSVFHRNLLETLAPRSSFAKAADIENWQVTGRETLQSLLSFDVPIDRAETHEHEYVSSWAAEDELGQHEKIYLSGEYGSKIPIVVSTPKWVEPRK